MILFLYTVAFSRHGSSGFNRLKAKCGVWGEQTNGVSTVPIASTEWVDCRLIAHRLRTVLN